MWIIHLDALAESNMNIIRTSIFARSSEAAPPPDFSASDLAAGCDPVSEPHRGSAHARSGAPHGAC